MSQYLVNYGAEGFLGRFVAEEDRPYRRGDAVLVRGHRGMEIGAIVSAATEAHARFLPHRIVGELLRPAEEADQPDSAFETARQLVRELALPMEVIDVEILLEPRTLIVHYFRTAGGAVRPLIEPLARTFAGTVELQDLALGIATEYGDQDNHRRCGGGSTGGGCEGGSCGSGGCGSGGGGCGSCGTVPAKAEITGDVFAVSLGSKVEKCLA